MDTSTTPKEKTKLSALDVAKYFIWKSHQEGKPISNKKLQKLLYYAQAWNLVFNDEPLFKEKIEAWVHGPAIPEVYQAFKAYGFSDITVEVKEEEVKNLPKDVFEFLETIFESYGKYPADYLEMLTHSETPWQAAREGLEPYEGGTVEIKNNDIKEFYVALYNKKSEEYEAREKSETP